MQTRFHKCGKQSGSVLMLTLMLALILGTTLASYLYWVRTQNLLVAESQAWNSALTIAEGGIEEGMAQVNVNVGTVNPLYYSNSIPNNFTCNGSAWFRTNSTTGCVVTISNDSPPTIYASATSSVPLLGNQITRSVMVKTTTNSIFGVAIAALTSVNNKGNDIVFDAYDSADTVHFPGGVYNSSNAFAGGDVALAAGVIGIGNSDIHGRLFLAPGVATNIGPNGLVGDMPANWPAQSGIEGADWVFNDFNKDFPDVLAPYSSGLTVPYYNTTNTYYLASGSYYLNNDLTLQNHDVLYVGGSATLYVTGIVNAKNGSTISVAPGATLKLYVAGASIVFNTVNTGSGNNAYNLQVFGLPTMTSFTLGGNDTFMGTLYAPETSLTLSGGGSSSLDFQGAIVVSSLSVNGHFNLHYDKNLSRNGPPKGYTLASWQEF